MRRYRDRREFVPTARHAFECTLVILGIVSLTGCASRETHSYDGRDTEKMIASSLISDKIHADITCPKTIEGRIGDKGLCTAPAQNGVVEWETVIQPSRQLQVQLLHDIANFEDAAIQVASVWTERSDLPIEVDCSGPPVIMIKDATFSCRVTVGDGDPLIGEVTVVNSMEWYPSLTLPDDSPHKDAFQSIERADLESSMVEYYETLGGITNIECPDGSDVRTFQCSAKIAEHDVLIDVRAAGKRGRWLWEHRGIVVSLEGLTEDIEVSLEEYYGAIRPECGKGFVPVHLGDVLRCDLHTSTGRKLVMNVEASRDKHGEWDFLHIMPEPLQSMMRKISEQQRALRDKRLDDPSRLLAESKREWDRFLGPGNGISAWLTYDLGSLAREEGRWREAAERYSSALAVLEPLEIELEDRAILQWDVARALWEADPTDAEKSRALTLAGAALKALQELKKADRVAEIQAWLKDRPGPSGARLTE